MNYNYHTHTYRCGHATGTPEEYILRAIEGGITHMGFSEHAPHVFSDGHESGFRLPAAQGREYIGELRELREKYRDRIDIRIGFEMEYYPSQFESMLADVRGLGAEYLILGQHFVGEEWPSGTYILRPTEREEHLAEYVDCCIAGMRSGYFSYIAHPDLCDYRGDAEIYDREMRRLCLSSKELNLPLEINFLGIRAGRIYPNERFWRIAGEIGSPVTFGFDAHDVMAAYDADSLSVAEGLVAKYRLNYIGRPKMIDIM